MTHTRWMLTMTLAALLGSGCAMHQGASGAMGTRVAVNVTDQGFVPATVTVRPGTPVTLEVTRRTAAPWAHELLIPDSGIRKELVVGEPVVITFTPDQAGRVNYSTGDSRFTGSVLVEK